MLCIEQPLFRLSAEPCETLRSTPAARTRVEPGCASLGPYCDPWLPARCCARPARLIARKHDSVNTSSTAAPCSRAVVLPFARAHVRGLQHDPADCRTSPQDHDAVPAPLHAK